MRKVILASTSRYRAQLLRRLLPTFEQCAPDCDETALVGESPAQLVERLAKIKADSVAQSNPAAIVIGSDQVADLDGEIFGKPASHDHAIEQLRQVCGRTLAFRTGVCVQQRDDGLQHVFTVNTQVQFRPLNDNQIQRYLLADKPYDCACSFRSESLGSAIVESMQSDDPSALIGLPLIRVAAALQDCGLAVP